MGDGPFIGPSPGKHARAPGSWRKNTALVLAVMSVSRLGICGGGCQLDHVFVRVAAWRGTARLLGLAHRRRACHVGLGPAPGRDETSGCDIKETFSASTTNGDRRAVRRALGEALTLEATTTIHLDKTAPVITGARARSAARPRRLVDRSGGLHVRGERPGIRGRRVQHGHLFGPRGSGRQGGRGLPGRGRQLGQPDPTAELRRHASVGGRLAILRKLARRCSAGRPPQTSSATTSCGRWPPTARPPPSLRRLHAGGHRLTWRPTPPIATR